jgi:hypothetical protein
VKSASAGEKSIVKLFESSEGESESVIVQAEAIRQRLSRCLANTSRGGKA